MRAVVPSLVNGVSREEIFVLLTSGCWQLAVDCLVWSHV